MTTEKKTQDFLAKEIESWKGFEYALREENRILFHEMLNECRKYGDATIAKGDNYSTESLFMVLILQQQKMINQLIATALNNHNTSGLQQD
jgi:hypothetical protein